MAAERCGRVASRNQRGLPFPEPFHTQSQVPSRLKLRIRYSLDRDIGQRMSYENTQVFWEIAKRVVTALYCSQHISIRKHGLLIMKVIGGNGLLKLIA